MSRGPPPQLRPDYNSHQRRRGPFRVPRRKSRLRPPALFDLRLSPGLLCAQPPPWGSRGLRLPRLSLVLLSSQRVTVSLSLYPGTGRRARGSSPRRRRDIRRSGRGRAWPVRGSRRELRVDGGLWFVSPSPAAAPCCTFSLLHLPLVFCTFREVSDFASQRHKPGKGQGSACC